MQSLLLNMWSQKHWRKYLLCMRKTINYLSLHCSFGYVIIMNHLYNSKRILKRIPLKPLDVCKQPSSYSHDLWVIWFFEGHKSWFIWQITKVSSAWATAGYTIKITNPDLSLLRTILGSSILRSSSLPPTHSINLLQVHEIDHLQVSGTAVLNRSIALTRFCSSPDPDEHNKDMLREFATITWSATGTRFILSQLCTRVLYVRKYSAAILSMHSCCMNTMRPCTERLSLSISRTIARVVIIIASSHDRRIYIFFDLIKTIGILPFQCSWWRSAN